MKILAIESSCDETAAAVVEDGRRVVSSIVASQVEEHRLYGGVVPEIASRRHAEAIVPVVSQALEQAELSLSGIDADRSHPRSGADRRIAGRSEFCQGLVAFVGHSACADPPPALAHCLELHIKPDP